MIDQETVIDELYIQLNILEERNMKLEKALKELLADYEEQKKKHLDFVMKMTKAGLNKLEAL